MPRYLFVLLILSASCLRAQTLSIAAAVSLREAITAAADGFTKTTGTGVGFVFGGSGQLLAQIKSGAPIDAFVSAAAEPMNELNEQGLINASTRRNVVTNTLVLIVPPASQLISFDQLNSDKVKRLALGQPKTVPAGLYAEQTLRALKLWEPMQPKLLFGSNVRQVLDYVSTGNADAGFVYATDAAQAGKSIRVVSTAEDALHEPIIYPAAVLKRSRQAESATKFLEYLASPQATQAFTSRGFGLPKEAGTATTRP